MMVTLKIVAMDVMPRAFGTIRAAITQSRTSLRFVMTVCGRLRNRNEDCLAWFRLSMGENMCALNLKRATTVIIGLRSVNTVVLPIVLFVVMSVRKSQAYRLCGDGTFKDYETVTSV